MPRSLANQDTMEAIFAKIIAELNSSVFVLLVVLGVVIWMTYKAGSLIEKFKLHEQKLDEARGIHNEMISIRTKVDLIYQNTNPNPLYRTQSPLALTPKGHAVSADLKAKEIISRVYDKLHKAIDEESPDTAYDIQVAALKVAKEGLPKLITGKELISIKEHAFQNGALLEDMLIIFGIMLRDRVLQERGIPLTEVDLSEPAKKS